MVRAFLIIFITFWGSGFLCGIGYQRWIERRQIKKLIHKWLEEDKKDGIT